MERDDPAIDVYTMRALTPSERYGDRPGGHGPRGHLPANGKKIICNPVLGLTEATAKEAALLGGMCVCRSKPRRAYCLECMRKRDEVLAARKEQVLEAKRRLGIA